MTAYPGLTFRPQEAVNNFFEAKELNKDFAAQILDSMAEGAEGAALTSVLCNRALCYQKMDLHRKALRVSLPGLYKPLFSARQCCYCPTTDDTNVDLQGESLLPSTVL